MVPTKTKPPKDEKGVKPKPHPHPGSREKAEPGGVNTKGKERPQGQKGMEGKGPHPVPEYIGW